MRTEREKTREDSRADRTPCANEGCPRQALPAERFCETCGLERSLYRRDLRAQRPAAAR